MRSSKGGSEAAATSAMAARRVESKEHVSDASGDRISRLGNRPEARRSMLELPDSLPLSSGTVNFMIFAMVRRLPHFPESPCPGLTSWSFMNLWHCEILEKNGLGEGPGLELLLL